MRLIKRGTLYIRKVFKSNTVILSIILITRFFFKLLYIQTREIQLELIVI